MDSKGSFSSNEGDSGTQRHAVAEMAISSSNNRNSTESSGNDLNTLARLTAVAAQLQNTVSGSLQTMAANLKQSVETMAAFNTMMETYLVSSLRTSIGTGKSVSEDGKWRISFKIVVSNIGAYTIPGVKITTSIKSTEDSILDTRLQESIQAGEEVRFEAAGIVLDAAKSPQSVTCDLSFASPGTGEAISVASSRPVSFLEKCQLNLLPLSHEDVCESKLLETRLVKADSAKLRATFGVHPSRGLAEFVFRFFPLHASQNTIYGTLEQENELDLTTTMVNFSLKSTQGLPDEVLSAFAKELE